MFTLVYSAKAAEQCGSRSVVGPDGAVCFTAMGDEAAHGPWKKWYHWKDAEVAGYAVEEGYELRLVRPVEPETPLAEFEEV